MKIHIVKKGDTLFELSKKYNVSLQKLIEANPQIANPDQLHLGDKVKIPASAVKVDGDGANIFKHIVKQGDSLWKLAKAWGLSLQSLVQANPQLSDPNVLKVGEVVNIPSKGQNNPTNPSEGENSANQSPIVSGAGEKKNTAPIVSGAGEKKNTAPIASTEKAEQMKPKPAPAPTPAPAPAPVNVEPPKPAPIPVPIKVDIDVEHITYEPIQYENIQIENIKAEESPCPPKPNYPVLPSPQYYQVEQPTFIAPVSSPCGCSGKGTQMDNENLFYQYQVNAENVFSYYDFPQMPQNQVMETQHSFMGEYPGISNAPAYQSFENVGPNVMGYAMEQCPEHSMENKSHESPWQQPLMGENHPHHNVHPNEMHGGMQQHDYGWPIPYGPSTCCCGSHPMHNQGYHHHEMMHPHFMNPYGYTPGYQEPYGVMGAQMSPGMYGMQGMPGMHGMHGMQGMPGMYGMQEMPGMHGMPGMQGTQGMPGVAGVQIQPNVPLAPLGGFGVPEPVLFDRDAGAEVTGSFEQQSFEGTEDAATSQSKISTKGKKEAKISGSAVSGKSNKKKTGSSSRVHEKKTRQATERARNTSEVRNPWIKE